MTDKEKKSYYTSILNSSSSEEFITLLPNKDEKLKTNMVEIVGKLEETYDQIADQYEDEIPSDVKDYLDFLRYKIDYCINYADLYSIEEDYTELSIEDANPKIPIFDLRVLKDIKKIPNEEYRHLQKAFDIMIHGTHSSNDEKIKRISSTGNSKLGGSLEYKDYQARILTLPIIDDYIYVYYIVQKKNNFSKKIQEKAISRCQDAKERIIEYKKILQNEETKKQVQIENLNILNEILDFIADKKEEAKEEQKEETPNISNSKDESKPRKFLYQTLTEKQRKSINQDDFETFKKAVDFYKTTGTINIPHNTTYQTENEEIINIGKEINQVRRKIRHNKLDDLTKELWLDLGLDLEYSPFEKKEEKTR